jgi:hypothetical protein
MLSRHFTRACGGLFILGLLILAIGCGPNYKARGSVKGKVSFAGKDLTTGTVMFHGKDNITGSATIDKNGNYLMNDAPLGDVKITVSVPKLPPGGLKAISPGGADKSTKSVDPSGSGKSITIMGDMPTHVVPIPDKYQNVETSGLTFTVKKGEQTKDLPLTP